MRAFVDTSALLAVTVLSDDRSADAAPVWRELLAGAYQPTTTNYVLTESCAVLQGRYGLRAAGRFHEAVVPSLDGHWGTPDQHHTALTPLLAANCSELGLVDCVSFTVMREAGIDTAFAFDRHFVEQGFRVLPG